MDSTAESRSRSGPDRRSARRDATRAEILRSAWEIARELGPAALSMRELGSRVGMRAQSLYGYFDAKDDILDAMFRQGYEDFVEWMAPVTDHPDPATDPVGVATDASRRFFEFCVADSARYQLLFQRTVPGFEPSPESYAVAVRALAGMDDTMRRAGIVDADAADLWTAVLTGLTDQQISNDPGGRRWERLIDRAVRMLLAELAPHLTDEHHTWGEPR